MAKFIVSIPIAGSATFEVEASDAKTAKEAAWEAVNGHCEPKVEWEWEYLESVSSGNVCHAPLNEISVTRVREAKKGGA